MILFCSVTHNLTFWIHNKFDYTINCYFRTKKEYIFMFNIIVILFYNTLFLLFLLAFKWYFVQGHRIPVPNNGGCDWGLEHTELIASCDICDNFYDPNPLYGDNEDGTCVYIPSKAKCFAAKYARQNGFTVAECGIYQL